MFSGKAYHSVDAKGRLFIPAMYREELGNKFIVARGFSEPYLIVYPEREWESLIAKIDEMGLEKNARQIKRYIMLTANPTEMDVQGRIVLSKEHREYAKFIKDVTVVGMGSTIEIWANEELVSQTEQPPENLEDFLATIK
jgi:MraZ protein